MSRDSFARMPERLTLAMEVGTLEGKKVTGAHGLLMLMLVAKADHRSRQLTTTSKALSVTPWWCWTDRQLRNVLHDLREMGEIAFESSQGSRRPYVITIRRGDYFERPSGAGSRDPILEPDGPNLEPRPGSLFQVETDRSKSEQSAEPQWERESERLQLATVPSNSPSTAKARRRGGDSLGWEDQRDDVRFDRDSLDPDVREAVARAEKARRGRDLLVLGDDGFSGLSRQRLREGHLTHAEHCANLGAHQFVLLSFPAVDETDFVRDLLDVFPGSELLERA